MIRILPKVDLESLRIARFGKQLLGFLGLVAGMLGFGKKPEPTQETPSVADISAPVETPPATGSGDADGFDRLRESVAAAMPATDQPLAAPPKMAAEPLTISEAIDYDEESSPTAFARTVGATTLQDLLEASAAYIDIVEGKSRFSVSGQPLAGPAGAFKP